MRLLIGFLLTTMGAKVLDIDPTMTGLVGVVLLMLAGALLVKIH